MNATEHYQATLPVLQAMEPKDIKQPHNIPVGTYIQESQALLLWVREDKRTLTDMGFHWEWVEDLPVRINTLVEAEAILDNSKNSQPESLKEWTQKAPEAQKLRDTLLNTFRFAFRKHPGLLRNTKNIAKGNTYSDMIQDLNDLSVLGNANKELLEAVRMDMSLLDEAARTSDEMGSLYADAVLAQRGKSNHREIRDRAYTHLKKAVDEIRAYGKFVFRENKERAAGYRSQFLRKRKGRKTAQPEPSTTPGAESESGPEPIDGEKSS